MRRIPSYCLTSMTVTAAERPRRSTPPSVAASGGASPRSPSTTSPAEAGVSRATLYRMFPGGKDVLFEALRVARARGLLHPSCSATSSGADDLEDLLVRTVVVRHRRCCATTSTSPLMLAVRAGRDARAASPSKGLPRIIRVATVFLAPLRRARTCRPRHRRPARRAARPPRHLATSSRRPTMSTSATSRLGPGLHPPPSILPHRPVRTHHGASTQHRSRHDPSTPTKTSSAAPRSTTSTRSSSIPNTDVDEVEHVVKDNADAIFTWDYSLARPALRKLYEKAKIGQWNATTDLPWDTEVDVEKVVAADQAAARHRHRPRPSTSAPPVEKWGDKEWLEFGIESRNWTPQPVPARRAGRAALHGQDRRDGAVVRRQALRQHPGGRRGPPRRGVRPLPRREARRRATTSTPTCGCCSTTSSTTAAGT